MRETVLQAYISVKTSDEPKIYPTLTGARVEFEIDGVSIDWLRSKVGELLQLVIKEEGTNENHLN